MGEVGQIITPCLKRESTEGTIDRELANRGSSQRDVDVWDVCPSSPATPNLTALSFHRAGGDHSHENWQRRQATISLSQSLNRSPVSTGCPEVEGLRMRRMGEGLLSPPFSLHTPVWAWLSQSARYKVALTCRQPWGGAGLAWHTQTGRAQGGSQVSSPGQVRARSPGTAPGQNHDF